MDHPTQLAWFEMLYPSMTPSTEPGADLTSTLDVRPQPHWVDSTSSHSNSNHTTLPAGIDFRRTDPTFLEPPSYSSFGPPSQSRATVLPVASYDLTDWPFARNVHPGANNELPSMGETLTWNGVNAWNMGTRPPLHLPRQDKLSQAHPTKTPALRTTGRSAVKSSKLYGARAAVDNQVRAPFPKSSNPAPPKERHKFLRLLKQTLVGLYPQCRTFDQLLLFLGKDTADISQRMPPSYLDSIQGEIESNNVDCENTIYGGPREKSEIPASQTTPSSPREDQGGEKDAAYVGTADIPWRPLETTTSDIEAEEGGAIGELKDTKERLACPYFQKTPSLHQNRRSCKGPGFQDLHRVKEHIYRHHELLNICNRCCTRFSSEEELRRHSRLTISCKPAPFTAQGCSQAQKSQLMKRIKTKGRTEAEKWQEMYLILFPDAFDIPSPYYEGDHGNCCRRLLERVKEYIIQELPKQELADGSNHIRHFIGLKSKVKKPMKPIVSQGVEDLFTKFSTHVFPGLSTLQHRTSDSLPTVGIPMPPHDSTRRARRRSEVSSGSTRSESAKRVAREEGVSERTPLYFGEPNTRAPSRPAEPKYIK